MRFEGVCSSSSHPQPPRLDFNYNFQLRAPGLLELEETFLSRALMEDIFDGSFICFVVNEFVFP